MRDKVEWCEPVEEMMRVEDGKVIFKNPWYYDGKLTFCTLASIRAVVERYDLVFKRLVLGEDPGEGFLERYRVEMMHIITQVADAKDKEDRRAR